MEQLEQATQRPASCLKTKPGPTGASFRFDSSPYLYDMEANMLSLRLPEELEDRLERLAKTTGRTKTYYAREAIEAYIQDLEDVYRAEKAYGDYLSGKVKSKPISELAAEYGL